jgi:aspartate aminotransferase
MTGWRIGYTASSETIANIMSNIQSHATSNPNTIAQYAGIEALNGDQTAIEEMRLAFEARKDYMVKTLRAMPQISCVEPKGAFYVMVDVSAFFGKTIEGVEVKGSMEVAALLIDYANIAVIPGIAFGVDDYIRLSYATSMENIEEGLSRLNKFCETY